MAVTVTEDPPKVGIATIELASAPLNPPPNNTNPLSTLLGKAVRIKYFTAFFI
jgi:hypothetical protein